MTVRNNIMKKLTDYAMCIVLLLSVSTSKASTPPPIPNPVLVFSGTEPFATGGKQFIRYTYFVLNADSYPNELFASAPDLPPCGTNTQSSRTWVDIFDQRGKRLYGFCALKGSDGLGKLWFALEADVIPPSYIYIEMIDRKINTKYKSNLAETTL